ncbi:DUF6261 family protein [Maribellus sp. YY47]|uniref:DUF6261 family protein n=1 Tax=Maribellus sp. YY47 TaxID=2929486 RepID=UPI00200146A6|nr:DUF6261 family protein [Maribellus sp. YY47]MCK3684977.1 DUF6261 family protein [Maribellus sp. YY47]
MSIQPLIANSRTTEVDGVATQVIRGYDTNPLNFDPNMEYIIGELKPASVLLSGAIRRMKEKSEAKAYDENRDDKIDALYYLLLGFSHHPDQAIRTAALYLLDIFNNYGLEMKVESLTRESSLINSLLADLGKPKAVSNIALLPQCDTYVAALQTAQTDFEANRLSYEEAQGEEGTLENASLLKTQVVELVNKKLVPYLNVMEQINNAAYGTYARTVAEIIAANNEVVKKRKNKTDVEEEIAPGV